MASENHRPVRIETTWSPIVTTIQRLSRAVAFGLLVVTIALTAGCFPNPPADDEGHASFAREAIPVLLGRRAHGVDEVEAVADISQLLGRDTAARMLMKDNAFVDHWADVLVDLLRMQRDFNGGLAAADQSCWGAPTRPNPDPAIAQWVRDHGPADAGAPSPAWNMTDLLRSAIALDDLSVVYRANLFTLSMRRAGGNGGNAELTDSVLRVYLNRDITCLRCHNPTLSASNKVDSGGNIVWRRLWTIPGHPEKALFGNYYDASAATARIRPIMRGDVRKPTTLDADGNVTSSFGIRPWGMADDCAKDSPTPLPNNNGNPSHQGFQVLGAGTANNPSARFGSLDGSVNPKVALWELEGALRQGIVGLKNGYERFPASGPLLPPEQQQYCDVVQVFSANCTGCHSGPSPSGSLDLSSDPAGQLINIDTAAASSTEAKRVAPGNTADSELSRRINAAASPPRMPPGGGLPAADKTLIDSWITAGAPHTDTANCTISEIPDVHPDEAFAFLTAANLVDGIWMAANGYRLTIDHGFPRNPDQRNMLWNLTEYTFLPNNWSLKSVLVKILGSNWFARRAPTISQANTAYTLPPALDPWIVADPTEVTNPPAHQRANGQGELVDRYRVNTLLRTLGATLAWKEPRRFPGGGYPSPLDQDLGQYLSPGVPGFRGVNFQSILALESQAGLCNKSGRSEGANDWIDKLVDDIGVHNNVNPAAPITLGDAWSILKDRLIQDPSIERALPSGLASVANAKTEEQALIAFLNQGLSIPGGVDLNTSTDALTANQLRGKLREACGILVKTPEFMLTNVTPRGYSDNDMPDPPRLTVCMDGESCGYPQTCGQWRSMLWTMGHFIACEDRSVRRSPLIVRPWPWPIKVKIADIGRYTPIEPIVPVDPGPLTPPRPIGLRPPTIEEPIGDKPLTAAVKETLLKLDAVRYHMEALCPEGLCGFIQRATVEECLEKPTPDACRPLLPPCDPRSPDGPDYCGRLPADVHDSGVLVLWAEDALITDAKDVALLHADDTEWNPLGAKTKLQSGDLLHVPLQATLGIQIGSVSVVSKGLDTKAVEGIRGHLIAVTGPSAGKLEEAPVRKGAITPAELRKDVEAGLLDSRAPGKKDWDRIIGYGARPESQPTPSISEINRINEDFDALHFPTGTGMTPDGRDLIEPVPGDGGEKPTSGDDDGQKPDEPAITQDQGPPWWLLIAVLVLIVLVFVRTQRKRAG